MNMNTEAAILERVLRPNKDRFEPVVARAILKLHFDNDDAHRMHELLMRNQNDELTPQEQEELDNYRRIVLFLDLLRSKARRALKIK